VTLQRLGETRVAFLHARTPTHSPPDVKTGRRTPRSLYTLLHSRMFLFCLLRVWLFAMGRVITRLDLTWKNMRAAVQSQRGGGLESYSPRRGCAMILQKSQPVETGHKCLSSASTGPLKNMDASPPARKAHAHEIHEKAGWISNTHSSALYLNYSYW